MKQIARNLVDIEDGFIKNKKYLIHDRDPLFTEGFEFILKSSNVEPIKLPAKSPNLNAYSERFVKSIKYECLNKVIPLSEKHLRTIISEYVEHCHKERNHQSLDNNLIFPLKEKPNIALPIKCHARNGGLLKYYYRDTA